MDITGKSLTREIVTVETEISRITRRTRMKKNKPFISSNEFKQYNFCPKQWYLIKTGKMNANTSAARRGMDYHRNKSYGIKAVQSAQSKFKTTVYIGGIVCLLWFWSRL